MTVPAGALVDKMLTREGDAYIFGIEVSPANDNPGAFDCSEIIEWACARLGVTPRVPDGSWYQYRHCNNHGLATNIATAIATRGALLFSFGGDPLSGGRPRTAHVAVSQGNGLTIEARSTRHGVGQFTATGRGWTHAGFLPGLDYENPEEAMLKTGSRGATVALYQQALVNWRPEARSELLQADGRPYGIYGPVTTKWVKRYQQSAELPVTGNIDGITAANLSRYVPAHNH